VWCILPIRLYRTIIDSTGRMVFNTLSCAQGISEDLTDVDADDPFAAQDRAEHDKLVAVAKGFEAKYVRSLFFDTM